MSNAIWPAGLPQSPQPSGYKETTPKTKIRTQMDSGRYKMRRRFTAAPRRFRMTLMLDAAQYAILDNFHEGVLEGGTLPFDWKHPITEAAATFQFVTEPEYSALGTVLFEASFEVEIIPNAAPAVVYDMGVDNAGDDTVTGTLDLGTEP